MIRMIIGIVTGTSGAAIIGFLVPGGW